MDIKDFISNFAQQFDDPEEMNLAPDTEFKKLPEWGSLTALSVICMIDDEYGKTINGETIREANTIQDLFNKIFNA